MKKALFLLFSIGLLSSCGNKNNEAAADTNVKSVDQYVVVMEAIYEKDDSLSLVFQQDDYYIYEKAVSAIVKGSPLPQQITFNIPAGEVVENVALLASSNKSQSHVVIKAITIANNEKQILKNTDNFTTYFQFDESFSWDEKNSRFILNHDNKYPPGISGGDQLYALLTQ